MSRKSSVKKYMFEARLFWVTDDFFIETFIIIFFSYTNPNNFFAAVPLRNALCSTGKLKTIRL